MKETPKQKKERVAEAQKLREELQRNVALIAKYQKEVMSRLYPSRTRNMKIGELEERNIQIRKQIAILNVR